MTKFITFIDGLPFDKIDPRLTPFLSSLNMARMIPTVGYSVALHSQIFLGKKPDEIGMFSNYSYSPSESTFDFLQGIPFLGILDEIWPLAKLLKIMLTKATELRPEDIPLRLLPSFKQNDDSFIYSNLSRLGKVIRVHGKKGKRDERALRMAGESDGDVFLFLPDMDHFGHIYGPDSADYEERLSELDLRLEELLHHFDGLLIFSDHGMSEVRRKIGLNLEEELGGRQGYVYFKDGATLRIWSESGSILKKSEEVLSEIGRGKILSEDERRKWGISNRDFGDLIYVLRSGNIFTPNFYGRRPPKGMHGYLPDESQHGAVFSDMGLRRKYSPLEVYELLKKMEQK